MHFEELRAVVGEVLLDADRAALERHDRHQVGLAHLVAHVLQRGVERADLVGLSHAGHVEVDASSRFVLIAGVGGPGTVMRAASVRSAALSGAAAAIGAGGSFGNQGRRDMLELDERDVLLAPSSVTTKSSLVSPSTTFPSLSLTVTLWTISRVLARKVAWPAAAASARADVRAAVSAPGRRSAHGGRDRAKDTSARRMSIALRTAASSSC